MFLSTYLPVDMNRVNCSVYSSEKVFPEGELLEAHKLLTTGRAEGVYLEDNSVMFMDSNNKWAIYEVYLAYEAYLQASKSRFSYYTTRDKDGIPQLFISKAFKGHRLLVNAFTMQTILLQDPRLVMKAASLIDKTISMTECFDLFNSMRAVESGSAQYLSGLLAYRDTPDEYLAVSPIMVPSCGYGNIYGSDVVEEIKSIVSGDVTKTESFVLNNDGDICRIDCSDNYVIPYSVAKYVVSVYDKTKEKKSNYLELRDENYNVLMYYSTNNRYLVNARTFECVVITNQNIKSLLNLLTKSTYVPNEKLQLVWQLAITE